MSRIAEFIRREANGFRSREVGTAVAASGIGPGDPIGKVTATGLLKKIVNGANDGSQNAVGIARDFPDPVSNQVVYIARDAEVETALVNLPAVVGATVKAALIALGIIFRS